MDRKTCAGYEIVCPDGRVRHFPFHNEGDAKSDAEHYSRERDCQAGLRSPAEWSKPPCPQGEHTVREIVFSHGTHGEGERGAA